jgi:hypothetical protein
MRTIESPGVEINEKDLSLNTNLPVGTTIFCAGYAAQGPTEELINVTSQSELEQIYGKPTNAAERYFYSAAKQVLLANGTLLTTRLPYGSGSGEGTTVNYSALVYPFFGWNSDTTATMVSTVAVPFNDVVTNVTVGATNWTGLYSVMHNASSVTPAGYAGIDLTPLPTLSVVLSSVTAATLTLSGSTLISDNPAYAGTYTVVDGDYDQFRYTITSTSGVLSAGVIEYDANVLNGTGAKSWAKLSESENYYIGQPTHITINQDEYLQWQQGGIAWKDKLPVGTFASTYLNDVSAVGYAGMIIVNEAKTTIDDKFGGLYIGIADNSKIDKGSNFDNIVSVKTINSSTSNNEWLSLNTDRLAFALTGTYRQDPGSISEIIETVPGWDFGNKGKGGYNDSVIITEFKLRPSLYNDEDRVLDKIVAETHTGSFDITRTINNPRGGSPLNYYIQNNVNEVTTTLKMYVNPYISERSGLWFDPVTGEPTKKVRIMQDSKPNTDEAGAALSENALNPAEPHGKAAIMFSALGASSYMSNADSLYGQGEYIPCNVNASKYIGDVPAKLERALRLVENRELTRVDIIPEAGLGTVWTGMYLDMGNWPAAATSDTTSNRETEIFDDNVFIDGALGPHTFDKDSEGLLSQNTGSASIMQNLYETIYNIFNTFCSSTRKDCLYVADPLRYIFVQGYGDIKVMDDHSLNFSQHVYWPLKNLFGAANSSYACTYANWFKYYDDVSGKFTWAPPSGWAARLMIDTDTNFYPWYAPAGLTRGILRDIVDIGINPTQKQRDLLYKIGINPTVYWPGDGYVIWGQKTLQAKPSAFDRINVRRLFLWLEKATLALVRYFVFEQNTVFTRNRLRAAISPIFEFAKSNEGIYDYMIVCDERNNTPDTIDRNELIVDIYIKPVRVAEFILVNFIATRTGQNFEELV